MRSKVTTTITDYYCVRRRIGRGAGAKVWRTHDQRTGGSRWIGPPENRHDAEEQIEGTRLTLTTRTDASFRDN